jgi:hypothetical protein
MPESLATLLQMVKSVHNPIVTEYSSYCYVIRVIIDRVWIGNRIC